MYTGLLFLIAAATAASKRLCASSKCTIWVCN